MTTSLTWTCNSCVPCVGCGIDSEHIDRFVQWENSKPDFLPFVFTKSEKSYCKKLSIPAVGLCAAFCTKEALRKALHNPYNFTDCEFFYSDDPKKCRFNISEDLAALFPDLSYTVKILSPVVLHKKSRGNGNVDTKAGWIKNHVTAIVHAFETL